MKTIWNDNQFSFQFNWNDWLLVTRWLKFSIEMDFENGIFCKIMINETDNCFFFFSRKKPECEYIYQLLKNPWWIRSVFFLFLKGTNCFEIQIRFKFPIGKNLHYNKMKEIPHSHFCFNLKFNVQINHFFQNFLNSNFCFFAHRWYQNNLEIPATPPLIP